MVRELTEVDLAAVYALRLEALAEEPDAFGMVLSEQHALGDAMLASNLKGGERAIFAVDDGGLVGMVGVYREPRLRLRHRAAIWGMYLRPSYRGRGLGAALLDTALVFAHDLGVRQVHLSVQADHAAALGLYRSRGFLPWGTEPGAGIHPETGRLMDEVHLLKIF